MDNTKERKVANRKEKSAQRGKHYYADNHNFQRKNTACPAEFTDFIPVSITCYEIERNLLILICLCVLQSQSNFNLIFCIGCGKFNVLTLTRVRRYVYGCKPLGDNSNETETR